jgi:hypothetical protein
MWSIPSTISKVLSLLVDLFREWRRARTARKSQAEFDAIEHDPVVEFKRMFDREKDARKASQANAGEHIGRS